MSTADVDEVWAQLCAACWRKHAVSIAAILCVP